MKIFDKAFEHVILLIKAFVFGPFFYLGSHISLYQLFLSFTVST